MFEDPGILFVVLTPSHPSFSRKQGHTTTYSSKTEKLTERPRWVSALLELVLTCNIHNADSPVPGHETFVPIVFVLIIYATFCQADTVVQYKRIKRVLKWKETKQLPSRSSRLWRGPTP